MGAKFRSLIICCSVIVPIVHFIIIREGIEQRNRAFYYQKWLQEQKRHERERYNKHKTHQHKPNLDSSESKHHGKNFGQKGEARILNDSHNFHNIVQKKAIDPKIYDEFESEESDDEEEHLTAEDFENEPVKEFFHDITPEESEASFTDDSEMDIDAKKAARKAARIAERERNKKGVAFDSDEDGLIEWSQPITTYSVLAADGIKNVLKVTPTGLPLREKPVFSKPDYIFNDQASRFPMPREWYDDLPENRRNDISNVNYILNPFDFCADEQEFHLLIIVQSAVWNEQRRNQIRSTWMRDVEAYQGQVKVIFSLGRDSNGGRQERVRAKTHKYSDVVQSDVYDSEETRTKRYISSYNWVEKCKYPKIEKYQF